VAHSNGNLCGCEVAHLIKEAKNEALEAVRKEMACSECNGSGVRSTPSGYSPCNSCEESGFNLDECFNAHFEALIYKKTQ
jgi:DnaJ-class molecular chaperone